MFIDETDLGENQELDCEEDYQLSDIVDKQPVLFKKRKKKESAWRRIEQLKDEAQLNKEISLDEFNYFD